MSKITIIRYYLMMMVILVQMTRPMSILIPILVPMKTYSTWEHLEKNSSIDTTLKVILSHPTFLVTIISPT